MFYTNVGSPNKLSLNDTYHDAAIRLVGWITGAASSPWAEVTGSAPTPTWLQPYASTAVSGYSSATYNGPSWHTTMYLTTDPGLLAGTPHCVLVKFVVGYQGLGMMIIDTAVGDPDNVADWNLHYAYYDLANNSTSSYGYDEVQGKLLSWSSGSILAPVADVNKIEINIWIWDECFAILCKDTGNTSYDYHGGGVFCWHPAVSGVIGAARSDAPHIWLVSGGYQNSRDTYITEGHVVVQIPSDGGPSGRGTINTQVSGGFNVNKMGWSPELGLHIETEAVDVNGDNTIQRLNFIFGPSGDSAFSIGCFLSGPWDEGPRCIRRGLLSTNTYLDTPYVIDGVTYTLAKDALVTTVPGYDCLWILPHSDLTV